jgi:predicted MFS family arabinose efflux permease
MGWLTLYLMGTDLFVVSPLLPRVSTDLQVSVSSAGLMVTVFSVAYVVAGPRLGALADRLGRPRVLLGGLVVFAAANLVTGLAPNFELLLVARFVAGLAASGVTPSIYAMVGAAAPPERRTTWLAVVTSGLLLALCTGAPAGSLLVGLVGWHGVFLVLAAAGGVLLVLNLPLLRSTPAGAGLGERQSTEPAAATTAMAVPGVGSAPTAVPVMVRIRAVSVTGLWSLAVYGVYTYLGSGLRSSDHFGAGLVAAALAVYGVGAVTGNLVGGHLADRRGARAVTGASLLGVAAMQAVLAFVVGIRPALFIGLFLFAVAAYPCFSAHQNRLVHAFPAISGAMLAWNNTALYLGILIGSLVGGHIYAAAGFGVLFGSAAAVALLGAFATRWAIPGVPTPARDVATPAA